MRSEYNLQCRFCDKSWQLKSRWLSSEILEAFANLIIMFHALRYHPEVYHPEVMTGKRFLHIANQVFWSVAIIIMFFFITLLQIVFYPLWWLLDKLYD